jgi:hypothetical protein
MNLRWLIGDYTLKEHGLDRRTDLCVGCGYDLRGLGDDIEVCPECGGRREATAARPETSG